MGGVTFNPQSIAEVCDIDVKGLFLLGFRGIPVSCWFISTAPPRGGGVVV